MRDGRLEDVAIFTTVGISASSAATCLSSFRLMKSCTAVCSMLLLSTRMPSRERK
jgi:hypothetical protein